MGRGGTEHPAAPRVGLVAPVRTLLTGAQEGAGGSLQFLEQFLRISSGGSSAVSYGVSRTVRSAVQ
jgi:hypothetical protein